MVNCTRTNSVRKEKQSIIYIIVELEFEERGQDRISRTSQKQMIKLKLAKELPTGKIGINDFIVKQKDHSRKEQKMTLILKGTQSDDILEATKIKSELVEVYIVKFMNNIKANNTISKNLIPKMIASKYCKQNQLDKLFNWAGHKSPLYHLLAKDYAGEER